MTLRRVAVSSWSLHRTLGQPRGYGPEHAYRPQGKHNPDALLKLPAQLAAFGIRTMELCHFHLPSVETGYLEVLRHSLEASNVELFSFLVDDGDIVHPDLGESDMRWIAGWLPIARQLGARCVRVIGGKQPPTESNLALSARRLELLSTQATDAGVRLMTENWHALLSTPWAVTRLMHTLAGKVGLCFDFGNWQGADKYQNLVEIAPFAESCHAKGNFDASGQLDRTDFGRCLRILDQAGFDGPYTLIFDSATPGEWRGLEQEAEMVSAYVGMPSG